MKTVPKRNDHENSKTINEFAKNLSFLFFLTIVIWLIILIVGRDFPTLGHDYRIHIPRLLDTHLHHLINGLTVQWYTPSFGSGLPAYPDPLYIQYSLPQLMLFITDPWRALMISIIIYSLIGAICFYHFLKDVLELAWLASVLGAIFIIANGFYLEHMIVGHVGYQQFPVLGAILLALFSKKGIILQRSVIIGIIGALIVHQAGFYLAVIFALSLSITLPLLYLIRPSIFEWRNFSLVCLTGSLLVVLLSLSKLSAVFSLLRFFPRQIGDDYGRTYIQGVAGILAQLLGGMTLIPYYLANAINTSELFKFFLGATGVGYGVWETDISLSPAVFILLIMSIIYACFQIRKMRLTFTKGKSIAVCFLLLGIWLTIDFSTANGWLYHATKSFPVLESLHVNVRFAATFIFPASLLAAYSFHILTRRFDRIQITSFFVLLSIFTLVPFASYLVLDPQLHLRNFNISPSLQTYDFIEQGRVYPVRKIGNMMDDMVFKHMSSNLAGLNNAIFGYDLENFHPETKPGFVFKVSEGYYNMTNPASYVFPEENNLHIFERFRVDQRQELKLFINRKQPEWKISFAQDMSNICSLVTVFLVSMYLVLQLILAGVDLFRASRNHSKQA